MLQISVFCSFWNLIACKTALINELGSSFFLVLEERTSLDLPNPCSEFLKLSISFSSSEVSHRLEISSRLSIYCKLLSYSFGTVSSISVSTLSNDQ